MTRLVLILLSVLAMAAFAVATSNRPHVQSVEQQEWLKERDKERELDIQRQREMGLHEEKHANHHFTTLLAPVVPALLMGTILLSYWLFLTLRSHRRQHFN